MVISDSSQFLCEGSLLTWRWSYPLSSHSRQRQASLFVSLFTTIHLHDLQEGFIFTISPSKPDHLSKHPSQNNCIGNYGGPHLFCVWKATIWSMTFFPYLIFFLRSIAHFYHLTLRHLCLSSGLFAQNSAFCDGNKWILYQSQWCHKQKWVEC